jgi:cytochrome c oxidase assembly protein subunit 16
MFFPARYQFSKKVTLKPEELEKAGVDMKETGEVTLETEFEKVKKIDIDNWEMVRGELKPARIMIEL